MGLNQQSRSKKERKGKLLIISENLQGKDSSGYLVSLLKSNFLNSGHFLKHLCLTQAFLFDLFSASRPSGFAETLSFLLELLSFFPLSFERIIENLKDSMFLH